MLDPIALQIGSLSIRWYGVIIAVAFALGIGLAYRRAQQNQIDPDHIINMVILIIPAAIIGARFYYVLFNWDIYRYLPMEAFAIQHGGLAIHGGLIGGFLAGLYYVRKYQLSPWQIADIAAPSVILGQAVGRWGNFINQEAHGGPVSQQFISHFPVFIQNQMLINGQYFHPTFLYESLWNLLVFIVLSIRWKHRKIAGEIGFLYLILYSVGRFFVEALRTDSLMLGPLKTAQGISLVLIIIGVIGLYKLNQISKNST